MVKKTSLVLCIPSCRGLLPHIVFYPSSLMLSWRSHVLSLVPLVLWHQLSIVISTIRVSTMFVNGRLDVAQLYCVGVVVLLSVCSLPVGICYLFHSAHYLYSNRKISFILLSCFPKQHIFPELLNHLLLKTSTFFGKYVWKTVLAIATIASLLFLLHKTSCIKLVILFWSHIFFLICFLWSILVLFSLGHVALHQCFLWLGLVVYQPYWH